MSDLTITLPAEVWRDLLEAAVSGARHAGPYSRRCRSLLAAAGVLREALREAEGEARLVAVPCRQAGPPPERVPGLPGGGDP